MWPTHPHPATITLSSDDEDGVHQPTIHPPATSSTVKVELPSSDGSQGFGHPRSAAREEEGPTEVPAGDDLNNITDPTSPQGIVKPRGGVVAPSTAPSEELTVVDQVALDDGGVEEGEEQRDEESGEESIIDVGSPEVLFSTLSYLSVSHSHLMLM